MEGEVTEICLFSNHSTIRTDQKNIGMEKNRLNFSWFFNNTVRFLIKKKVLKILFR